MTERLSSFLGSDLLRLVTDGERLLDIKGEYSDYSFAVFPFAKAYEGFLKKLFLEIGAINKYQYESDHWRVGRALNPLLEKEIRHTESVYDRIVEICGGTELAETLWQAWRRGRNQIFHFFPRRYKNLTLEDAKEIVREILSAMEKALEECKVST